MARIFFDVMCVVDLIAAAGRPTDANELAGTSVEGRIAASALQGTLTIDTSHHVLDTAAYKLREVYDFTAEEATRGIVAFARLVELSGGVRIGKVTDLTDAKTIVPADLHSRVRSDGLVDHEDFTMLTGFLEAGSEVLVTRDGPVLDAAPAFRARRGRMFIRPQSLAARRVV